MLPLDGVPGAKPGGSLLKSVSAVGAGAPWVEALLGGVDLVEEDGLLAGGKAARVTRGGATVDGEGIVRIGNPTGETGILERKERLRVLETEAGEAEAEAAGFREAREAAQASLREAETRRDVARGGFRTAEDTYRGASAEVAAAVDRKERMDRHRDELARQVEGTRAAQARASERAVQATEDRTGLVAEEAGLGESRAAARAGLEQVQEAWETARAEQSRLEVQATRLQGESSRLTERLANLEQSRKSAQSRGEALDREEKDLTTEMESVTELQARGADETQQLFSRREAAQEDLREKDGAMQAVAQSLDDAERKARSARQEEREAVDRRHRLELERQELDGRIGRIQERLEGEWGRPLAVLMEEAEPVEGEPEALREELKEIVVGLEKIGPVNMLAVEEHKEESERLDFLTEQHQDLIKARNDLKSAIREINETATKLFTDTFQLIRENFRLVHQRLFEGGEADIWLSDEEDPLESPVEIHASPRGKKTQRIDLLSGGERALTALSLLFSIYLVKPSPFCVLDEVDAPLDENNIGRFIRLLRDFSKDTQFVVITHNPRTIEAADWIYGVTMEEPGVSTIVGFGLKTRWSRPRARPERRASERGSTSVDSPSDSSVDGAPERVSGVTFPAQPRVWHRSTDRR